MLTLKDKINRILGNNVRLLLPSYWWKRVFGLVVDRIDKVEQSTSKLIDSKVKEVKMPIVESVDELSKLNLPKGGVAAVEKVGEPVVVNLEDCYLSADAATDWDKYTVIRRFSEKGAPSNAVGQIHLYSDKSMENGLTIACGEGKYFYYRIVNGRRYDSSLEKVNKYLASGKYRLVFGYYIENVSAYVTLYSAFPQPSLYIKGDSWERLAKESDLEGIEGGSGDDVNEKIEDAVGAVVFYVDTNGGQLDDEYIAANAEQYKRLRKSDGMLANRPVYVKNYDGFLTAQMVVIDAYKKVGLIFETYEGRRLSVAIFPNGTYSDIADASSSSGAEIREFYTGDSLTDEQKAWNLETFQLFQENKCFIVLDSGSGLLPLSWHAGRSFVFQYGMINTVTLNYEITVSDDGSTTTRNVNYLPDEELSTTSANVVTNRVVTTALNNKADKSDIKTINGVSLLGGGDITISGGGVSEDYVNTAIANAITTTLNTAV